MKIKRKIFVFNIIYMVLLIYFVILSISEEGIIRDEFGITGEATLLFYNKEVYCFYLPIIVIFLNSICLSFNVENKSFRNIVFLFSICSIILSTIFLIKVRDELNTYELKKLEMEEMSLNSLMDFMEGDNSGIIYIKRDDCIECSEMDAILNELLIVNNKKIYIYSTTKDRESNPQKMYDFLETINVNSVPTLIDYERGEIKGYFSNNNMDELKVVLNN